MERSWCLEDFEVLEKLGEGKMAQVFRAVERRSNKEVALKIFAKKPIENHNFYHQTRREVEIQYHLHYKHILKLYGYFQSEKELFLVLEFVGGRSLHSLCVTTELEDSRIRRIVYQLSLAVMYMHLRGVIHRDLKLENVLIDSKNDVKVIDFGWSVHCPTEDLRATYCGTVLYLSPEIVEGRGYDKSVDIWALGVLMYELYFKNPPFYGRDKKSTFEMIVGDSLVFPKPIRIDAENLLRNMLNKDPRKRIKIEDVLQHCYFRDFRKASQN